MGLTMPVHISAGGLGIISGFVALYAAKGAWLHHKSGMLLVFAMLTMAVLGIVIPTFARPRQSEPLTRYFFHAVTMN